MASCRDDNSNEKAKQDVAIMPGKDYKTPTKQPLPNRAFALRMLNPMRYQDLNKSPLDKELRPVKDSPKKKSLCKKPVGRSGSFSSADDDSELHRSRSSSISSSPDLDSTEEYINYSLGNSASESDRPFLHRTMSAIGSFTHGSIRSALSSNGVNGKRDKKYMKVRFADSRPVTDAVRDVLVRSNSPRSKQNQRNPRTVDVNSSTQPERHSSPRENIGEFRTESAPPDIGYSKDAKPICNGISNEKSGNHETSDNDPGSSDSDDTVVGEDDVDQPVDSQRCLNAAEGANEVKPFENEVGNGHLPASSLVKGGQLVESCPDILVTSFETGENVECHQTNEVVRRRQKSRPYGQDRDEFAKRLSWVCNLLSERCPGDFQVLEALVEMQYAYERREDEVNKSMSELRSQVKVMEDRLKALELFTLPGFSKVVTPMSDAAGALLGALQSMSDACRTINTKEEANNKVEKKQKNRKSSEKDDPSRGGPSPETPV